MKSAIEDLGRDGNGSGGSILTHLATDRMAVNIKLIREL